MLDGQQARLTQAALETLAVVAYKQPVSRASAVRGVNVDGVMRTLISRGLVEEAGADTESQATLYRTTSYFLERMGMQSLDDLPELAPYLPEMDDMEEELAAQSAPPADPEAGTDPEASAAHAGVGAEANPEPEIGGDSVGVATRATLRTRDGPARWRSGPDERGELDPEHAPRSSTRLTRSTGRDAEDGEESEPVRRSSNPPRTRARTRGVGACRGARGCWRRSTRRLISRRSRGGRGRGPHRWARGG